MEESSLMYTLAVLFLRYNTFYMNDLVLQAMCDVFQTFFAFYFFTFYHL